MLQFINRQNIAIFNSFSENFLKVINEIHDGNTITIEIINSQHPFFSAVADSTDPFATNTIMNPQVITINEQVCLHLNLTQEKQYAIIAHEIGHILDDTARQPNNQLIRECNADQFAVNLGLSQYLISGLEKIIDCSDYSNERAAIICRIKKLANLA